MAGIRLKDVFSNRRLFLQGPAQDLYAEEDYRLYVDFFGYGSAGSQMLIGQLEMSLLSLVQESLAATALENS